MYVRTYVNSVRTTFRRPTKQLTYQTNRLSNRPTHKFNNILVWMDGWLLRWMCIDESYFRFQLFRQKLCVSFYFHLSFFSPPLLYKVYLSTIIYTSLYTYKCTYSRTFIYIYVYLLDVYLKVFSLISVFFLWAT